MRLVALRVSPAAWLALCLCACGSSVRAQDSFDGKAPTSPAPAQTQRPSATRPGAVAPQSAPQPGNSNESHDFGIQPVAKLRPSDQLHGPTPTTIPGGRVVSTRQLAQWMHGQQGPQGRVLLLHAIGSNAHLPNAVAAAPASQGGSFDDAVQREFAAYLQKATGGDLSRLLVTYCQGVQCWGSYNAALRAIHMGYKNVHWYRGGMEAWQQAGLPLLNASSQNGSTPPR
jgi:PQQ-dependent catabolism-associated CXXCW motif protein